MSALINVPVALSLRPRAESRGKRTVPFGVMRTSQGAQVPARHHLGTATKDEKYGHVIGAAHGEAELDGLGDDEADGDGAGDGLFELDPCAGVAALCAWSSACFIFRMSL